ncbi:MAG: putative thiamine biosynthesis protein [Deltaproteobacteria bacterium ADurb.Bin207]|nr:MAG: putative thiamine biosynthesis protein [Deltaproteobacteria bacterium ADurb.Bin207]
MVGRRSSNRGRFAPAAWVLLWVVWLWPVSAWADASSDALERVVLQLKWKHQFQSAGFYAAVEQGYYRTAGIVVEIWEATGQGDPADVVLRGDAQFGIASSDLIILRAQGKPVVALAPIYQHSPMVLLVSEKSGIDSVHGLKGKRIMLESHADELIAYLHFEGIERGAVTWIPHVFDPSRLIDGTVDATSAYSTDEPFLLQIEGMRYSTYTPRSGGIDFYGDTLFTTEEQVRMHPDRVRRFLEASLEGWKYAMAHEQEVIDLILNKYSKRHSREHLLFEAERSRQLIMGDVVEIGYVNPGRWQHIGETYQRMGTIQSVPSLSGFLYERNPQHVPRGLYGALVGAFALTLIIAAVAYRFYRLSVQVREQAESLRKAMAEIKVLSGIIPICAHCKKIRDDQGYWNQLEAYISNNSDALFSHGICEDCEKKYYP